MTQSTAPFRGSALRGGKRKTWEGKGRKKPRWTWNEQKPLMAWLWGRLHFPRFSFQEPMRLRTGMPPVIVFSISVLRRRFLINWRLAATLCQVYWCHFSNGICSLWVSLSCFDNSGIVANFCIIIMFVMLICDQWPLMVPLPLTEGSDENFLTIKYFLN